MHSADSLDITFPANGSRLLSESPVLPSASSSHTGHGGDDLSISELSLSDRTETFQKPFSLLAQSGPEPSTLVRDSADGGQEMDEGFEGEDAERNQRQSAKVREEKLRSDIFVLKKLNASFALFNEALENSGSANERVAAQLEQTDALLNKYVSILSKSEEFARLILDEQWQGAEVDEEIIERERREVEEKTRREAEERAIQREQREQERLEREASQRIEKERQEKTVARGGVRGVRGTRASMRGTRGTTRAAPAGAVSRARPSSSSMNVTQTNSGGIPTKRPTSAASVRSIATGTSTRGISRRS